MTGRCTELVASKRSRGIIGKGTESFTHVWKQCSRAAEPSGDLCGVHRVRHERIRAALAARNRRGS